MTRARDLADYISTGVSDTELDVLDGVTAGTVTASKALVVDANKDIASVRNITVDGTITLEGATANDFETVLNVTDPTADRTITFPDSTGTVYLNPNTGGYSASSLADNLVISDGGTFAGITIHANSSSTGTGYLLFADNSSQFAGYIGYSHTSDLFSFVTNTSNTQMQIDSSGVTIFDGLFLGDSHEINLGSSNDFKLYHDGFKNYIEAGLTSVTDLLITSTDDVIIGHGTASSYETMASFFSDNAVVLYYNNSEKIRTSSSGIDVSGYVDVDSGIRHNGDTNTNIEFGTDTITFDTGGSERLRITSTGLLGVGDTSPAVSLDIGSKTDAVHVPSGTTAQRPTGANGMFRYNTTDGAFEGYAGGAWGSVGGGGAWSLVDEVTVSSNTNTVDLEGMNSTYKVYAVVVSLAAMDSGENVFMRFKNQGSYDTSAIYSNTSNGARSGNNGWYIQQRENLSAFEIMNISSISQAGHSCMMYIYNASSSTVRTNIQGTWMAQESGQAYMDVFAGSYSRANSNAETDGIRFFPNNRNWTAGNFRLYGIGG